MAYYDQLFLSTNILNWQKYMPPYPEEPQDMIRLTETIFCTHRPTRDDIIQLLTSLFGTEEQYRILTEAKKWLLEMVPEGTVNPQRWVEQTLPYDRPNWDYNTDEGRSLPYSHSTGTKKGSPQTYGYGKTCQSSQRGAEPPSEFYERLCEAYRLCTLIDPEARSSHIVINSAFVSQAYPDIKRKLQKLDGVLSMSSSQLIEIAKKVFRNRDVEAKKETEKRRREDTKRADQRFAVLAAALGRPAGLPTKAPPSWR